MAEPADPALPREFGKYELLEQVGLGGMAVIYRARVISPDGFERIHAIKQILPEFARQRAFVQMLIAEAKVTSLLDHENIVPIHELGEIDGRYYIAMEYVDGADLLEILERCARARLRVPTEVAIFLISEVCKGLAHAHAATDANGRPLEIIHRDVSPSNILLSRAGAVKVMDFGVAHADLTVSKQLDRQHRALKGKLGYMSPEQVSGAPIDKRSDVFALGVILFECLTLKRLFVGKTDAHTITNIRDADVDKRFKRHSYIPQPVRVILRRALAKDPDARYQTATDLREALLDYLFESRLQVTPRSVASFLHQIEAATHPGRPASASARAVVAADGAPPPPDIPELPADAAAASRAPRALRRVDLTHAVFYFRNDGDVIAFGPVDFRQLHALLRHRAIGPLEWVSVNGSDWLRIRDVPSIVDLYPPLFDDEPAPPLYDGPLNRLRTPHVLNVIHTRRLAGRLKLLNGSVQKSIYFDRGQPVAIHSNIKDELLGAYLIRRGHVSADQVAEAIDQAQARADLIGQALRDRSFLTPETLRTALEGQFVERILEPFRWESGWYEIFPGDLPDAHAPSPTVAPLSDVVMRGIRAHYPLVALDAIFHDYLDSPIVLDGLAPELPDALALTPRERECFAAIGQGVTLGELLAEVGPGKRARVDLLRVAFALYQRDHLAFRTAARPAS